MRLVAYEHFSEFIYTLIFDYYFLLINIYANIFTLWISRKANFERLITEKIFLMNIINLNKIDKIILWHRRLGLYNINSKKIH